MEKVSLNPQSVEVNSDRATIVIQATYQEFDPSNQMAAYHGFDWINPAAETPFQTAQKISPSERSPLNIGHLEWGRVILVLSNDKPRTAKTIPEDLRKAIELNTITLTNADGQVVGIIRPRRASVVEYPFPVFAQANNASALLSITAFPVTNDEEIPA
jgi:hypothetical protein